MKINIFFLFLNLNLLLNLSCSTTDVPPDDKKPTLTLSLEDTSCTETWLQLTTKDLTLPAELTLKQFNPNGDSVSQIFNLSTKDSLLYIDSLLPNQRYSFQVSSIQHQVSSIKQPVTTMDTTSHNFTWQTFTFGTIGSSTFYDVAIIDENDIWAVGEIYMNDSLGNPDNNAYNAVYWNGQSWELKRIKTNACGGVDYPPIKAIFAFSSKDILFAHIDGSISHFNGIEYTNDCSLITQLNGSANKIWGRSRNDFYVVSGNGFIAHYQNGSWTKLESGTDLEFLDIYGATDPKTNEQQILAVCTRNYPLGKAIFKIDGNTAIQIPSTPIQWELFSCWFIPNRHYYVVGSGIYEKSFLSDSVWRNEPLDITHYGTSKIRGNGINDVFVVGAFGEILHNNGFTWKSFLPELGTFSGSYGSLDIKGNIAAITGFESAKAKITIGRR